MVVRRESSDEAVSIDAAGQRRGALYRRPIFVPSLCCQRLEGQDHRRQPSDLLSLFPRQDHVCDWKGRDVRLDKGSRDGLDQGEQVGHGHHQSLAGDDD